MTKWNERPVSTSFKPRPTLKSAHFPLPLPPPLRFIETPITLTQFRLRFKSTLPSAGCISALGLIQDNIPMIFAPQFESTVTLPAARVNQNKRQNKDNHQLKTEIGCVLYHLVGSGIGASSFHPAWFIPTVSIDCEMKWPHYWCRSLSIYLSLSAAIVGPTYTCT